MRNGNERRETMRGTERRDAFSPLALNATILGNVERISALLAFSGRYDTLASVADARREEANRLMEENALLFSLLSF